MKQNMDCNNIKREPSDVEDQRFELPVEAGGDSHCGDEYGIDIVENGIKLEVSLDGIKQEPSGCYGLDVSLELVKREASPVVGVGVRLALPDYTRPTELGRTQDDSCATDLVKVEHMCHVCSYKADQSKLLRIHQLFSCHKLDISSECGSIPGTSQTHPHRPTTSTSTDLQITSSHSNGEQIIIPSQKHCHTSSDKNKLKDTELRQFYCDQCDYKCTLAKYLKAHKFRHTGLKPFICDQCDYKCAQTSNLKTHKLIHMGVKPFDCDQCDYMTNRKGNLKIHKLIHTGLKPFACEQCDFKCINAGDLKRHKLIHTGLKPFACDLCDYKCIQACILKRHKLSHSDIKPFTCDQCDHKCTLANNLKRHKLKHSDLGTNVPR